MNIYIEIHFGSEGFKQGVAVKTTPCYPAARWTKKCLPIIPGT
jgi:hypothetical protein